VERVSWAVVVQKIVPLLAGVPESCGKAKGANVCGLGEDDHGDVRDHMFRLQEGG
jgi:hypothetical protein